MLKLFIMEAIAEPNSKKLSVVQMVTDTRQPLVVSIEKHKEQRIQSETKLGKEPPLFYTEPIFKPKKYDPL